MGLPASSSLGRRAFLAAVAAATSACRTSNSKPVEPRPPNTPPLVEVSSAGPIDESTIAAAERVLGVQYTAAERRMIAATIEDQSERSIRRRKKPAPNELAPALTFDPRLPLYKAPAGPSRFIQSFETSSLPRTDEDIAFAPAHALARWIREKRITSARLTEIYVQRVKALDPKLHSVVTLTEELARAQAAEADADVARGRFRSRLHGVPWGVKDLFDTSGIPTTWGAEPFRTRVPEQDAVVVRKLTEAGGVLVAKLSTGALAYGEIWYGGATLNPWNPNEGSSGSSAGPAAAVAAGLVGYAIGTETYGSIVSPSMRCGTTGLRPTFGRIPRTGCMALCWSLDKVGPITRTVEDAACVLSLIYGQDRGDPGSIALPFSFDGSSPVGPVKIGYDPAWFGNRLATKVDRRAFTALKSLGAELVPIRLADTLPWDALLTILLVEAATAFEDLTLDGRDDELSWQGPEAWPNTFRQARFISGIDYLAADRIRRQAMQMFADLFDGVELIFGPSFAEPMLLATNCTGHPSLTLRAGFLDRAPLPFPDQRPIEDRSKRRMPHGVTLWGRLFDEGRLLRVGMELERALGVWNERPPMG